MLTYGRRIPLPELDYRIEVKPVLHKLFTSFFSRQQVDAKVLKEVCTRYIYDKCPVVVGIGKYALPLWLMGFLW